MRVLIIAAHPDDEIMGVGGTIAKHVRNGDEDYLSILTNGVFGKYSGKKMILEGRKRKDSCLSAAKYLGIKKVIFVLLMSKYTFNAIYCYFFNSHKSKSLKVDQIPFF